MTITRRELMKEGIIAAASALPLVNLITESKMFFDEATETTEPSELDRLCHNHHTYHFEVFGVRVILELSQWVATNRKTGIHKKPVGGRILVVANECLGGECLGGEYRKNEWASIRRLFYLDSSLDYWRDQRAEALEALQNLPVEIVRSEHPLGFQYDYQAQLDLHEQVSPAAVNRALTFIYICGRFVRIIERMTPPDQIIVETYPELASDQAGSNG